MKKLVEHQAERPLFVLKEGGLPSKESYIQEALSLPWVPPEPRVKREKLLLEVKESLTEQESTVIFAPLGMGATSLLRSLSNALRVEHACVFYISLMHIEPYALPAALRSIRKTLLARNVRREDTYLLIDDIMEVTEEVNEALAHEAQLISHVFNTLFVLRPKAALLKESFSKSACFYAEDLMVSYDEIAAFCPQMARENERLQARHFYAQTKGLAALADAYHTDFLRKNTRKRRHEKEAVQQLLRSLFSECELSEERKAMSAMMLLQAGSFAELKQLGIKHVIEIAEAFANTHMILGINMALEEFSLPSFSLKAEIIQNIESFDFSLLSKAVSYLLDTRRLREALYIVKHSKEGFENKELTKHFKTIDALMLFNAGGSYALAEVYKNSQKSNVCKTAGYLLHETTCGSSSQNVPADLLDFAAFRKSFRTLQGLPQKPHATNFASHFAKHYNLLLAFSKGAAFNSLFEDRHFLEQSCGAGIIETFVEAELLALRCATKGECDETIEAAFQEACAFFEQVHEKKLLFYAELLFELAKVVCGIFTREAESLFERVITKAKREKDFVIVALALFGKSLWDYKHDFYIMAAAEAKQGLYYAQKAKIPFLEDLFVCLLDLNFFHVFFEVDEIRQAPKISCLQELHNAFVSVREKDETKQTSVVLTHITPHPVALILLQLAIEKVTGAQKILWRLMPDSWRKEYKRRFVVRKTSRPLAINPQTSFDFSMYGSLTPYVQETYATNVLELHYLGGFCARLDGQAIHPKDFRRTTSKSILEILALEPSHRIPRRRLEEVLWPERNADKARSSLYAALSSLKKALGDNLINSPHILKDNDFLCLNMDNTLVDLDIFQQMLVRITNPEQEAHTQIKLCRDALRLYGDGIQKSDDHPLYNLLYLKEKTIRSTFADALVVGAKAAKNVSLTSDFLVFAKKAHELVPAREDAFKLYVDALHANNRITEAEELAQAYAKRYVKKEEPKTSQAPKRILVAKKQVAESV